jgi:hypothetical protein
MTEPTTETQRLTPEMIQPTLDNKIPEDGSLFKPDFELNDLLNKFVENPTDITRRFAFLDELAKRGDHFRLGLFYLQTNPPMLSDTLRLRELDLMAKLFQNAVVGARRRREEYIKNGGDEILAGVVDNPDELLKKYLEFKQEAEKLIEMLKEKE